MAKRKTPAEPMVETAERVTAPKMSKADAVRAAVAGGKSKPQEACAWIKSEFGIEITPQHFSSYKSQQAKKAGNEGPSGRSVEKPTSGFSVSNGGAVNLARQVKALVIQYGADEVSGMLAILRD